MKNENAAVAGIAHNIVLESREKMSVSGVEEVLEFDENEIVMESSISSYTRFLSVLRWLFCLKFRALSAKSSRGLSHFCLILSHH